METHKLYLGDSVYVEVDAHGRGVRLTTDNGFSDDPRNEIFLEPEVLSSFFDWVDARKKDGGIT
jgi:hypothetical protein